MTRRMTLQALALTTVALAGTAWGGSGPVPSSLGPSSALSPEVTWHPDRPRQGDLFLLRVTPAAGETLARVTGRAGGEALHFSRPAAGVFESLAPVPVDQGDAMEAHLTFRRADGSEEVRTLEIPVIPGSFEHEDLTVAPEYGSPLSKEARARLARDQAKARRVSREAGQTPRMWSPAMALPRDDRVTSGFGNGRVFNGQVSSRHMGLDLDGEPGDTVVAATRGVVALVDEFLLAGDIVYLNHGGGLLSGYFHLSAQLVAEGDTVGAGTPIGLVGATGRVTGPHLHWVVRYGSTSVDPRSLLLVAATPE